MSVQSFKNIYSNILTFQIFIIIYFCSFSKSVTAPPIHDFQYNDTYLHACIYTHIHTQIQFIQAYRHDGGFFVFENHGEEQYAPKELRKLILNVTVFLFLSVLGNFKVGASWHNPISLFILEF